MRAVPDPRCDRKIKHDHAEVLVCLVCGFLAGKTTIRRSLKWCRRHVGELRKHMPLKNGIASPSTVSRLLSGLDEQLFALEFMEWIGEIVDTKGIHLAIDGKALRAAMEKVKDFRAPMVLNAMDAVTGLVIAQMPIQNKECEIRAIPELLKLLDISGSVVTTDAIGTQTEIMEQIVRQKGNFVMMIKKNQPQSYEEIMKYLGEMSEDFQKMKKDAGHRPKYPELQETYEEVYFQERNRDRYEHRWYSVCREKSILTKTQKEWSFIRTVGRARQIRIPLERDAQGRDITPDVETFLKKGSRRRPKPLKDENVGRDIQDTGMISDLELTAEQMGKIKREHWAIENKVHHVLDESFREDRSPAKESKNNLALIRKYAYNILRLAMLSGTCTEIMTEAMDEFSDDHSLIEKYVFNGIKSLY